MKPVLRLLAACCLIAVFPAHADESAFKPVHDYVIDLKDYALAPFRFDEQDYKWLGSAVAATAIAYTLDNTVRAKPFAPNSSKARNSTELRDALPLIAMTVGTFAFGELRHNSALASTGTDMAEAAVLATLGATVLKYAAGRLRPDQTLDRGQWGKSGSSFPSGHTAAVFAAAQVLSDRLTDDQRVLRWGGYGLAGLTAYARINGNRHWLSDTVAGAALGMATGRFLSQRRLDSSHNVIFGVAPAPGGMTLYVSARYN